MSKKQQEAPETAGIDGINDSLTAMTQKVQDNRKIIVICSLVIVAIILIVLAYVYFFLNPALKKHNDNIGSADLLLALSNDSIALKQYMDIADNGNYEPANRAALESAILLYREGKYEEALKYAEKYSTRDEIIGAGALSLKGDCLVNLDRLSDAVSAYKEAISVSDRNPAYTPYFIMKLVRVYHEQGNFAEEVKMLEEIQSEYPLYGQQHNLDIEKLLDRARLMAAK